MATQTTGGGSTTSFTNTPQAKDDYYSYEEDWLRNSSYYNIATNIVTLDVMSNDLGGSAKALFSVATGDGDLIDDDFELINKDVGSNGISPWEMTQGGNWVRINNGKLEFRLDDGLASTVDGEGRSLDSLAAGQAFTDSFVYAIRLANGTLSEAIVTINITGAQDIATISGSATGNATEDVTLTATGTLTVTDPDSGENELQPIAAGTAGANGHGTFEVLAGGQWTYTLNNADPDIQALGAGETAEDSITVWSEDGTDSQLITITITGTNDAPVLTVDTAGGVSEDVGVALGLVSDTGTLSFTDVDTNDTHSVSSLYNADAAWTGGSLSAAQIAAITSGFSADADSWDYSVANADLDFLGAGETITLSFDVTVTDDSGSANDSDTETVTITITGTNDAPVLTGTQATLAGGTEDVAYIVSAASLLAGYTDVDGDTVAVANLSADHGSIIDNGNGTYTVTPAADYFGPVLLSYNVVDGNGGVTPATLSFNLAAVNDPAIIAGPITGTVVEATPANAGTPTATGTLTASDVDNPPNSFVAVASTATASGYGSYTMSASGVWVYTLNNSNGAVNALATGMFLIDTFTVQSADGTTQTITVTINGMTDVVVVTPPAPFTGGGDPNDFDTLVGGAVNNTANISGGGGNDTITGGAGDQTINGNNGNDTIYGGGGVDTINGGNDNDTLYGQAGNDDLNGNNGLDSVYGGSGNDAIVGGNDADTLYGGSGSDTISGAGGNDILIGGYGSDTLSGDGGADTFLYLSVLDTNDFITDFLLGTDQIDLSALDANSALGGDQAFGWGGNTATANSLWFEQSGTDTVLYGDTDGNTATAEFMITLQNVSSFTPYSDPLDPPPPGFTF